MPDVRPFHGLRYSDRSSLPDLVCPPYDVISDEEQASLYDRHPHNAVRLELGRGPRRYEDAGATFRRWLAEGVLRKDEDAALYVYRQDFVHEGRRRQVTGVLGALGLEPLGRGVLPHERTMAGPKEDRLALLTSCPVNVSPIYTIYRGSGALSPFFAGLEARPTDARVQDQSRVLHRLWVVRSAAENRMLRDALATGPLVIADGHHRYETALAFHEERVGSPGGHDAILAFCVDADSEELVVRPYNRILRSSMDPRKLRDVLIDGYGATQLPPREAAARLAAAPKNVHAFVFVTARGDLYVELPEGRVAAALPGRAQAWAALDVVALHEVLLPDVLPGGADEFAFSTDEDAVRALVARGWTAGVLLRPLRPPQVVDVARSGERMPQKATYFWPKAVTGLVMRSLDPA